MLDSSKLRDLADDNFKFKENGEKFSKWVEKKKLWEKEKLLVTSNFSFSHSVFKRLPLQTRKIKGLFGKGLTCCTRLKYVLWIVYTEIRRHRRLSDMCLNLADFQRVYSSFFHFVLSLQFVLQKELGKNLNEVILPKFMGLFEKGLEQNGGTYLVGTSVCMISSINIFLFFLHVNSYYWFNVFYYTTKI